MVRLLGLHLVLPRGYLKSYLGDYLGYGEQEIARFLRRADTNADGRIDFGGHIREASREKNDVEIRRFYVGSKNVILQPNNMIWDPKA